MKTRTKGKAITGIAMAAIMLASIAAMVPTVSATSNGTNFNYINASIATAEKVLVGQNLQFVDWTGSIVVQKFVDSVWYYYDSPDGDNRSYNVNWDPTLTLQVNDSTTQLNLAVKSPTMPLKLVVGTSEVSSVTLGTDVIIDTGGINLFGNDQVNLVIIGPDGQMKTNPTDETTYANATGITVTTLKTFGTTAAAVNTTDWKIGDYTFQVKTVSVNASGLDASSDVKELSILKGEIDISAETTTVTELETIKLTVTGVYGDDIDVNATPESSHVLFQGGIDDTPTAADGYDNFSHSIDADGKRTYVVKFNATGSYTIKVFVTSGTAEGEYDTVDITVAEKAVTFDVPTTVIIGERLTIKGHATSGERVTIAVEDVIHTVLERLVVDGDGNFEKEIDTTDACEDVFAVPGSVRLKAYIGKLDQTATYTDVPDDWTDDGTAVILMKRGGLTAELSTTSVAQEDDFTISGVAKGSGNIDILIVAPKGSSGSKIEPGAETLTSNIYLESTSVSEIDDTYSKKVTVGANVDTGSYLVVVLSTGSDGKYGLNSDNLSVVDGALAGYNFAAKTQEQVLTILEDALWGAAGSDDLYDVKYVKVAAAVVTLDPVASVGIGDPLVVSGTTNRKEGFAIVVTCKGPVELTPATVTVKDGKFNTTFDTSTATVGTYTIKVDDGDGHTDDVTVDIVTKVAPAPTAAPTAEPTAAPTAAPVPTAAPTATPEPTPEPPGFEAVFAIAGLLSIAYLVLRKRRE